MASLAQNVGENPRHVPWNNKNTEFEGRRQNMMGYSCMKAVYEYTPHLHDREKILILYPTLRCITHKKVSNPAKKVTDKQTTGDPIRCLAVMKLARSEFAHKKNSFLAALFSTHIVPSIEKCMQLRSAYGHSFVYVVE